jgi:glycosyltransferase involved in cell wall biosynthesis
MTPIRVLQVSNQLGLGGTDATLQVLATRLNRDYFDVFAAGVTAGGAREEALRQHGIPTIVARGNLNNLSDFIHAHSIDIVHLHHCRVPLPILSGRHVLLTHQFSKCLYPLKVELQLSRLLFNSTRTLQKYLSAYSMRSIPENAEIIYNPVDLAQISEIRASLTADEIAKYRQSLGIEPGQFVIGRLGRSDIVKWSDFLIEACRPLIRARPDVKVLIQTAPPSRINTLRSKFPNNLIVLPESASPRDLALFFATIDVYAHTSKIGESFGVSIAEAMAFGKAVVVNSTPGVDNAQIELVDNRRTGFVVRYPVDFARAIETLLDDRILREQMGEAGYAKIKQKYSADIVTGQYERILFSVMSRTDAARVRNYANSLPLRINPSEMQRSFKEYDARLSDIFGSTSMRERIAYKVGYPARLMSRIVDYIEYRQQQRAENARRRPSGDSEP